MLSFERPHEVLFEDIAYDPELEVSVPRGLAVIRENSLTILDRAGIGASTFEHTVDVYRIAREMSRVLFEMGHIVTSPIQMAILEDGAIRHDIGKAGMDAILDSSDTLTADTRRVIRTHPFRGLEQLAARPDTALQDHPDMDLDAMTLKRVNDLQRLIVIAHHDYYTPGELADIAAHPVYGFDKKLLYDEEARALLDVEKFCDISSALTSERPYLKARLASEGRPTTLRSVDEVMSIIHETIPGLDGIVSAAGEEIIEEKLEYNAHRILMRDLMAELDEAKWATGSLRAFSQIVNRSRESLMALVMPTNNSSLLVS